MEQSYLGKDFVFKLPDELTNEPQEGEDILFEDGLAIRFRDKYFIHALLSLPINKYDSNPQLGIWVEVSQTDYNNYLQSLDNEDAYEKFECVGSIKNDIPVFPGFINSEAKLKVTDKDQKVRIVKIKTNNEELIELLEDDDLPDVERHIFFQVVTNSFYKKE